ncbi:SDR family NAD(P)-dependent oxidoreductase [Fervidibacillus halotolerans]|uniref:SDR family NAD(P)-dependent oxidoreductase n=1 Tax=Fervidibacillus halotolerans TaxID=2980027 RepID=A0A9E8LYT4_9BACI|nr:SDR family NAD(P)-dependent oxidoreductase [Fervidibacillus halotolerans]WAA12066.1 SDR family NAD(P)-dependent oxidoreductase [Fervidibacillus halotolerans]
MRKMLVLGASGGMGYSIVNELVERGYHVRAFARNRERLEKLYKNRTDVELFTGDLLQFQDILEATKDVDIIFHAAGFPYVQWAEKLPVSTKNILEAAKQNGAKLAVVDNIYAYGRASGGKVTERKPKNPHTKKGKIRLQMEQMIKQSGVEYVIAHFPDFYGPNAENSVMHYFLENVMKNKKAIFVGDPTLKREYIFTPDGAKALVSLALTEKAYGQNWNIPGYGGITGEEIIRYVRHLTGYRQKVRTITKWKIKLLGLFDRNLREVVEMFYLYEQPIFLSGEKYERELGPLPKTPYEEGLKRTVEFMKKSGDES